MRYFFDSECLTTALFSNFAAWKKCSLNDKQKTTQDKGAGCALCLQQERQLDDLDAAEQELTLSIRKSYDLYHYLLLLLISLSDLAREKVALSANKRMPGPEDLNPNKGLQRTGSSPS
jgi:hypothetical protein